MKLLGFIMCPQCGSECAPVMEREKDLILSHSCGYWQTFKRIEGQEELVAWINAHPENPNE